MLSNLPTGPGFENPSDNGESDESRDQVLPALD